MININLKNNNFNLAEKLYLDLLENDDLNSIYKSAIATHAAYSFINVININTDLSYSNLVENYISRVGHLWQNQLLVHVDHQFVAY